MRFIVLCVFSWLFVWPAYGEELLPKVQRELRARKFYFGEINGRATKETTVAIMRFQRTKGIDGTGNLDADTMRALGFSVTSSDKDSEERQKIDACCAAVLGYYKARESEQWNQIEPFFAEKVDYYFERTLTRHDLERLLTQESRNWPRRTYVMLNRIASLLPENSECVQVTVRIQTQSASASGDKRADTEDLIFRLEKTNAGWKIAAVKQLE